MTASHLLFMNANILHFVVNSLYMLGLFLGRLVLSYINKV